jgi:hypothetical protein
MSRGDWRRNRLPARTLEEVHEAYPTVRQSLLAGWDNCALSTLMELEGHSYTNAAQARGILFHRYAGEVLRTLRATGEVKMPTEEAMAILYEVCAQRDVPVEEVVRVPARERRLLRVAAIKLVSDNEFNMARLVAVERRLEATVVCQRPVVCGTCKGKGEAWSTMLVGHPMADGRMVPCPDCGAVGYVYDGSTYERRLTGQPDALLMDPDPDPAMSGAVVLDWKTTRRAPAPGPPGDHHDDGDHVSYMGYFQQRFYGLLVLRNYRAVNRVRLRRWTARSWRGRRRGRGARRRAATARTVRRRNGARSSRTCARRMAPAAASPRRRRRSGRRRSSWWQIRRARCCGRRSRGGLTLTGRWR